MKKSSWWVLETCGAVGVQSGALVNRCAVVGPPAAVLLVLRKDPALKDLGLALLFFHEEIHQQNLLLVHLQADVFGDVWN